MSVHGSPGLFRAAGPHGPITVAADDEGRLKTDLQPCYGINPQGELAPLLVDTKGRLMIVDSSSAGRSFKSAVRAASSAGFATSAEPPVPQASEPATEPPLQLVCHALSGNGSLKTIVDRPCRIAAVHIKNHTMYKIVVKLRWRHAGPPESESARADILATGVRPEFLDSDSIREKLQSLDFSQKIDRVLDGAESWSFTPTRAISGDGGFCSGCLAPDEADTESANGVVGLITEYSTI
jgi:hypothetical protein